jgi:protein-disulfide isomerase
MNTETKVVGVIGIITILIIAGGLWLASKNGGNVTGLNIQSDTLVRADSPRLKGSNADVQIVEFGDLECPACKMLHPEMKKLLDEQGDKIDFVFRFIPIHAHSKEAAAAALAAGEQGKFFEMSDIMFDNQDEWSAVGADFNALFSSYAGKIGLDMNKYAADLKANQNKYYALVDRDAADAAATRVDSTPTLIFNGKYPTKGATSYENLKKIVDQLRAESGATSTVTAATGTASN